MNTLTSNVPIRLILILIVFFSFTQAFQYGKYSTGLDYYLFWAVAGDILKAPSANVYSLPERTRIGRDLLQEAQTGTGITPRQLNAAQTREVLEIYSTPFLFTAFTAFHHPDFEKSISRYLLVSLLCALAAIVCMGGLLRIHPYAVAAMIPVFTVWFAPLLSDIRVANVNQLQLGLLALFLVFQRLNNRLGNFIGGLVLGLATMFKPNLVFVVILLLCGWLISRQERKVFNELAGISCGVAFAFAVSSAYFGSPQCWLHWSRCLREISYDAISVSAGNYSLAMLVWQKTGFRVSLLLQAFFTMTAVLCIFARQKKTAAGPGHEDNPPDRTGREFRQDALLLSLGCLVYLLSAPLVWFHYYILAIPMILCILSAMQTDASWFRNGIKGSLLLAAVACISLEPLIFWLHMDNVFTMAAVTSAGAGILYILGLAELLRPDR